MRKYCRLTRVDRYQIDVLLKSGQSLRGIAHTLGRSPSSLSRELKRNFVEPALGVRTYEACHAHLQAQARQHKKRPRRQTIVGQLENLIRERIELDWSPEQIVGRLKQTHPEVKISYQSIYRYVYRDALNKGELFLHLRSRRKRRTPKVNRRPFSRPISPKKEPISTRPKIALKRVRLGDYERDLVHGAGVDQSQAVILSIVDRTSRYTKLGFLSKKSAESAHLATVRLLKNLPVKTITNDNGTEFAQFSSTAKALKARVYFCYPGCCWERATNENTNGLLRQYFPKGSDFKLITPSQIKRAENLLNHRPRKCLGFKTPTEIHRPRRSESVALVV